MLNLVFDLPPCTDHIAAQYEVPPALVRAIHDVEAGWPGAAIGPMSNGEYDLGVMQVNGWWLKTLKEHGFTEETLRDDACSNITAGVWILAQEYAALRNWPEAIAAYNRGRKNRNKGAGYAKKVISRWFKRNSAHEAPKMERKVFVFTAK